MAARLFIDEIADMPRETQNKILRVLVDQTFHRVGGNTKVDGRRAHHFFDRAQSGSARSRPAHFREDLYHRLSVVPIRVPPLAERREDIPMLVDYFMDQISAATGLPKRTIGEDAMAVLQSHDWPGNVRQLRNNVERLMILAGGDPNAVINAEHAAAGRRLDGAVDAERQWRRATDEPAAARGARNVRARISRGADQPLRRQHLADRRIRRHGALGAAPQAESARDRLERAKGTSRVSRIAYVNGRYLPQRDAAVHVEDRGYQFADGVYEVCEVRGGRLIDERRHMERLAALARANCGSRCRCRSQRSSVVLHEVVRRNGVRDGIVYLQITRGVAKRDHAFPPAGTRPAIVVTASRIDPAQDRSALPPTASPSITVPDNRWDRVDIKSIALLPNVLAKQTAREQGAREAWFVDADGTVTEGSSSNAWIVTPATAARDPRGRSARSCAASRGRSCSTC